MIIQNNKNDGQVEDRRKVHGLVHRPSFACAIPKQVYNNPFRMVFLKASAAPKAMEVDAPKIGLAGSRPRSRSPA
jgi:hypothetical protein